MFDRIMRNSMPIWLIVSVLFPIFLSATLIKAWLHFRRIRSLPHRYPAAPARTRPRVASLPLNRSEDWVPTP